MTDTSQASVMIHATCVAWGNHGILLRGPSGTGKSDLALRVIESGGVLVSDDQVLVTRHNNRITAQPPDKLAGLLEIRGVGICNFPFLAQCDVVAIVDLDHQARPERLPDLETQKDAILNVEIAQFVLNPFQASAPAKLRAMLQLVQ